MREKDRPRARRKTKSTGFHKSVDVMIKSQDARSLTESNECAKLSLQTQSNISPYDCSLGDVDSGIDLVSSLRRR